MHGWRSSFRDWAGDCAETDWNTAEAALAHSVGSKSAQAYRRRDALEKRRVLMGQWWEYLNSGLTILAAAACSPLPKGERHGIGRTIHLSYKEAKLYLKEID